MSFQGQTVRKSVIRGNFVSLERRTAYDGSSATLVVVSHATVFVSSRNAPPQEEYERCVMRQKRLHGRLPRLGKFNVISWDDGVNCSK